MVTHEDVAKEIRKKDATIYDNAESQVQENETVSITVLRFALRNNIIMMNVVNFLGNQDLDLWYEACKTFKFHDVPNMDRIFWKNRAKKLAEAIGMTNPVEEQWPDKTTREIFSILRVKRIQGIIDKGLLSLCPEDIADAASLAYHGMLESF